MITDPDIRDRAYQYFLEEAPELLQTIEEEIFAINEGEVALKDRALRVNSLMRAAHTIKGGAANVGLETIQTVAHSMEDVFKALYNPELEIDLETKRLIYESFECLREPLTAEFSQITIDRDAILDRAATVFGQLQTIFGDYLTGQDTFPTSEELGLDVVESFFDAVIPERLQELATAIADGDRDRLAEVLLTQAEIFIGLAESLSLPGFGEIAQTIVIALNLDENRDRTVEIAQLAIANIERAKQQVLAGDRERGGEPSPELLRLANIETTEATLLEFSDRDSSNSESEIATVNELATEELEDLSVEAIEIDSETDYGIVEGAVSSIEDAEDINDLFSLSESTLELLETDNSTTVTKVEEIESATASIITEENFATDNEGSELLDEIWNHSVQDSTKTIPANDPDTKHKIITKSEPNYRAEPNQTQLTKTVRPLVKDDSISDLDNEVTSFIPTAKVNTNKPDKERKSTINKTVRVNLESLEKLNDLVGELLIDRNQNILKDEQIYSFIGELLAKLERNEKMLDRLADNVEAIYISPEQQKLRQELPQKLLAISQNTNSLTVKDRQQAKLTDANNNINQLLKSILNNNSEVSAIAEKIKSHNKQIQRNSKKQQRMLLNMRDELIETRMSPIGRVFNRFPRMLQQLSSTYNKPVELKIVGGHILVDKTIEEKLYDPLLHIIRNSFDHGIETPDIRQQQGKPTKGTIELRAYYQGGKTIIEIKDDGKGLDIEKIKNRAIENKLITPAQANTLGSSRLLELLFEPGFSTADKVSSLSGRGVGLDVVRSQIEAMEGSVSIESVPQKGTVFALQIPLSLTIAKLMLTEVKGMTYALLIDAIERIIVPTSDRIRIFEGQKVLHWQTENNTEIIPVRKLADSIEYPRTIPQKHSESRENTHNPILLLRRQEGLIGLEVDRVLGEQELVIRPLGSAIAPPQYIYGCSVLKDSSLTLVIDAAVLLKLSKHTPYSPPAIKLTPQLPGATTKALPPSNRENRLLLNPSTIAKTLLVIDDSSSLRQTIAMSLEKVSDRVYQAENGLKALEKLQKLEEVNLIVCDLEMPMMNGFQFLKALRQTREKYDIPVIILTSRDSDKHRQLALQLGAAAYLIKPCDEKELFAIIETILQPSRCGRK